MGRKVVAIVGSYRKGGIIDTAVQAVLEGAREKGAETQTIYLTDRHLEFCENCRRCTQAPGLQRGQCVQKDDLQAILDDLDAADAIVLGSPVNYWNATAIFRRFMERLLGATYWPWGMSAPQSRNTIPTKKAVLVSSSAMPGFCIPLLTGAARALRITAKMLGAKPVGRLWIGLAARQPHQELSARTLKHAHRIGLRLV
ncbi:MAG: flavodoxin family protein [Acidobacteriaceae bacterium]|jgi:NAD(P)H-dependent FMN reductase